MAIPTAQFPAVAANASQLPYTLRLKGWRLAVAIAFNVGGLIFALAPLAGVLLRTRVNVRIGLLDLVLALTAAYFAVRLWRLKDPELELFPDRVETPGIASPKVLYRSDIAGVGRTITTRYGSYFNIVPRPGHGDGISLSGNLRDDPVFAEWLRGAPDPEAVATAADRARVLADARYGANEGERAARLQWAKRIIIGFSVVCGAAALWIGFLAPPGSIALAVAGGCVAAGYALVTMSDGLIVWRLSTGARPTPIAAFLPAIAVSLRGMVAVDLIDPDPLIIASVVVGVLAAVVLSQRTEPMTHRLRRSLVAGAFAGVFAYGAGAFLDTFADKTPSRSFTVTVEDKHVTGGRSTTYDLDLAPWDDQPAREVSVSSGFYDSVEIGGTVCIDRFRGSFRLPWFNVGPCLKPGQKTRDQYLKAGESLMNAGQYPAAIGQFDHAVALDSGSVVAWSDRALAHLWIGDVAAAKADVARALALDPGYAGALNVQGLIAERLGRPREAMAAYGKAIASDPKDAYGLRRRAADEIGQASYDAALKDLDAALALDPHDWPALLAKASAYRAQGRLDEVKRLASSLDVNSADQDVLLARAQLLLAAQDQAGALAVLNRAIELMPTVAAYFTRARVRAASDPTAARADAEAAWKLDPRSPDVASLLAWFYGREGRNADALRVIEQAIAAHPGQVDLEFQRASYLARAGRAGELPSAFAAIRARIGRDAPRLNRLCWEAAVRGVQLDQALKDCDASLRLAPSDANTLDSRGYVLLRLGRYAQSAQAYSAALAQNPKLATSMFGRSVAEARLGQSAAAASDAAAAKTMEPKIAVRFSSFEKSL